MSRVGVTNERDENKDYADEGRKYHLARQK